MPVEADKQISLDSDASDQVANSNQKLKLGAEHIGHSSCVEGGMSSFEGIAHNWKVLRFLFHMEYLLLDLCSLSHLLTVSSLHSSHTNFLVYSRTNLLLKFLEKMKCF